MNTGLFIEYQCVLAKLIQTISWVGLWCYVIAHIAVEFNAIIPEYDALYDLKKQWYDEFVPFLSNQPGIAIVIIGGDVARRYVHQTFGSEKHAFDRDSWVSISYKLRLYWIMAYMYRGDCWNDWT